MKLTVSKAPLTISSKNVLRFSSAQVTQEMINGYNVDAVDAKVVKKP